MSLPVRAIRTQADPRRLADLVLWYSAGDTSRNWTTTAATTAVAADADPVGRVDSAASTNYLEQATAAARPQWRTAQRRGMPAWSFDGSDDRLVTTSNVPTSLIGNAAFSLGLWLYVSSSASVGTGRAFVGFGDFNQTLRAAGMWFGGYGGNIVSVEFAGGNSAYTTTAMSRDRWTHVCVTKRPGAINTTMTIYHDGVAGTLAAATSTGTPNLAANPFAVGQWANYTSERLQCLIDQVVLYSRELSAAEVRYLAQGT